MWDCDYGNEAVATRRMLNVPLKSLRTRARESAIERERESAGSAAGDGGI